MLIGCTGKIEQNSFSVSTIEKSSSSMIVYLVQELSWIECHHLIVLWAYRAQLCIESIHVNLEGLGEIKVSQYESFCQFSFFSLKVRPRIGCTLELCTIPGKYCEFLSNMRAMWETCLFCWLYLRSFVLGCRCDEFTMASIFFSWGFTPWQEILKLLIFCFISCKLERFHCLIKA